MPKIPKHIHFFWATDYLPKEAFDNIVSFIAKTDTSWNITLWTDDVKFIKKSPFLPREVDSCFPSRVAIKELWSVLDECVEKLKKDEVTIKYDKLMCEFGVNSFGFLKTLFYQLLTGLTVPAAAKDCFMPLALYCYGGYAFDLDAKAVRTIQQEEAPKGVLLLKEGRISAGLAMAAKHEFAIYSFLFLNLFIKKTFQSQKSFHDLEAVKDRRKKHNSRVHLIIRTTGSILTSAFQAYATTNGKYDSETASYDPEFLLQTSFRAISGKMIAMGVEFYLIPGKSFWRKKRNPNKSFEIDNADIKASRIETRDSAASFRTTKNQFLHMVKYASLDHCFD